MREPERHKRPRVTPPVAISARPREPLGWANCGASRAGKKSWLAVEFALYSDASPIGEGFVVGPLEVINTLAARDADMKLALVARCDFHDERDPPQARVHTHLSQWTGVDVGGELSALLSLALGIRCRSGGMTREFRPGDPRGLPVEWEHRRPYLAPLRWPMAPVIPRLAREVQLDDAYEFLLRYSFSSHRKAVALVRAAMLYQQALWTADDDPNQAWLYLVSACEVAADEVTPATVTSTGKRVKAGARARFTSFICDFCPPPPETRPQWGQLDWDRMERHANQIYTWRSAALHDGMPFPASMCHPPGAADESGAFEETPAGLATSVGRSTWKRGTTPMLLHTFVYITRGALCNWWRKTPIRN
jgi:hypothetical protein